MQNLKYEAAPSIEKWDQTWTAVSTYQVSSAGLGHIFRLQHYPLFKGAAAPGSRFSHGIA